MANQPKKYKKFVATAATATLVASAIVPVASAASLTDIAGNTHEAAITSLVDAGIINGYADGTFKPNKELTRSDVVKLLGKYLVTQGYEIPSDAVSSPRFADLTSKSNKELLEYAAVVADAGVFAGSNGKLLAGDPITRENMAIVLVRMVNTLKDVSLEDYVDGQKFDKEVKDLNVAKAEARSAINVLDFYDITTATNFLPKNTVTRGQFATFLNNVIKADFTGVSTTTGTVKAINATTVEVTFGEEVADVKALDFAIDKLTISNAVVKQTDKKTVVLTTSAQTAGVEYTVTVNEKAVGKFTGLSAVVPTKVELVSTSVQGKLGQQVSVQAKVTVVEGQSKAGIPVTFSIPGNANDAVYPTVTGEAYTDANGIATYTYTRYGAGTDAVTAYATGDRSKFAVGYVFWGVEQILTVEEVTVGATINNGANKTYKVTYKNATTGKPQAGVTLNVSALENINVTADKLQNVTVNGVEVAQLSNSTVTRAAQITTDSKGEATFTVSGANAEATPVVFAASNTTTSGVTTHDYKYDASDLQTTAAKVKFAAVQAAYTIELTRDGGEVAATGEANGREYKVLVKDKDGKVAKNETVNVAFNEDLDRVIATNTKSGFVNPDTDKFYPVSSTGNELKQISVKTNDKGEATFIIASDVVNDYATPIAWIDINTSNAKQGSLDEGEPKTVAAISHFQAPYLNGAEIKAYKTSGGKATDKFDAAEPAVFKAELVNQSGKVFTGGYTVGNVTYTVTNTGAEDVKVGSTVISPNRSETFTIATGGSISVESADKANTSVSVVATGIAYKDGKDFAFTAKEAKATFTNSKSVTAPFTGYVTEFNTADTGSNSNSLWFAGKNPIKYTGTSVKYFGANGNEIFGEAAWEAYLTSLVGKDVQVSYSKDGDNTIFKVISVSTVGTANALTPHVVPTVNNAPTAKTVGAQTVTANGTPLVFTTAQLAEDVDAGDVLTVLSAYTNNATIATATATATGITVSPVGVGTTTVSAVIADRAGAQTTVTFDVVVTAATYFSLVGNPGVPYSETAATPASIELTPAAVGGPVTLTLTEDVSGTPTPTTVAVTVPASASADALATLINNQAGLEGKAAKFTAVSNGTLVKVTTPAGDNTISSAGAGATAGTTVAGTAIVKNPAAYSFKVDGTPTAGTIVKVAVGAEYYEYTVTAADVTANSPSGLASAIVANLATQAGVATPAANVTAFDAKYAVTTSGNVVIITQKVAASNTDSLAVTTR